MFGTVTLTRRETFFFHLLSLWFLERIKTGVFSQRVFRLLLYDESLNETSGQSVKRKTRKTSEYRQDTKYTNNENKLKKTGDVGFYGNYNIFLLA